MSVRCVRCACELCVRSGLCLFLFSQISITEPACVCVCPRVHRHTTHRRRHEQTHTHTRPPRRYEKCARTPLLVCWKNLCHVGLYWRWHRRTADIATHLHFFYDLSLYLSGPYLCSGMTNNLKKIFRCAKRMQWQWPRGSRIKCSMFVFELARVLSWPSPSSSFAARTNRLQKCAAAV